MALGSQPVVGLDIGTSAVRAAQVSGGRGGASLTAFAQVPLPPGAVVDGEVRDAGVVTEAISQLWKRAKLRSKKVVLGVANQRVVVRQIDIPYLEEKDLRSSLKFQVADHIPMSADDAELDFEIVEDFHSENGDHMMRLLLVAASSDMVEAFVDVVASAGLEPVGVDLSPFAASRAVSGAARGDTGVAGAEAIVDVGAGVTNIVIHVGGEPRFVRILLLGGDDVTNALAQDLEISFEEAEALKLDLGRGGGSAGAVRVLDKKVDSLVNEIRGSIDYFSSQDEGDQVSRVVMTGGGSLTSGLASKLETTVRIPVVRGTPLTTLDYSKSGLTQEQAVQVDPVGATAVGLAMGESS